MTTQAPIARRLPDGRLMFGITSFALGTMMVSFSLWGSLPEIGVALHKPARQAPSADTMRMSAALPSEFTARPDLAAQMRHLANPVIPSWERQVAVMPSKVRVRHQNLCREFLLLANLQRRIVPERPAGHYLTQEPDPDPFTLCSDALPAGLYVKD